jgi:hypothetical protein
LQNEKIEKEEKIEKVGVGKCRYRRLKPAVTNRAPRWGGNRFAEANRDAHLTG